MFWIKKTNEEMVDIYITKDEPFINNIHKKMKRQKLTLEEARSIKNLLQFAAELLNSKEVAYDIYKVNAEDAKKLAEEFHTKERITHGIVVGKIRDNTQKVYVSDETITKFGEKAIKELLGIL